MTYPFIKLISDVHEEFSEDRVSKEDPRYFRLNLPQTENDKNTILIVAGDLNVCKSSAKYNTLCETLIKWSKQFKHVIFVMGNHDYWYGCIDTAPEKIKEGISGYDNIHFLEKDFVILDGVRFWGGTFWTNMVKDPIISWDLNRRWSDLQNIRYAKGGYRRVRAADIAAIHNDSVCHLKSLLDIPFDGPTIVVTHHAPCELSTPERFRGQPLNVCYVSDQTELMDLYDITLWCHGHTHNPFDYEVYDTRILCNPHGYHGIEVINGFNPALLLSITEEEGKYITTGVW